MKKTVLFLSALLIFLSPMYAEEETEYTNNSFARLNFVTGNTYIQKAADLGYEEAILNMPIAEGDRLGTTDGRAEIYLGKGNYIRLDKETKIDFMSLPKSDNGLVQVRIWAGNAYFSVRTLEEEKNIEIHTSDVSVYVLDAGLYRVDVRQNRETEIFVFEGMVEAAGETGSVLIKDGQRLEVSNARFTSRPSEFINVAEDSFDKWSTQRESVIRQHLAKKYMPEELEDFEYELANYGDWIYILPYGNVWVPRGIDTFWRPYFHGRWSWLPLAGWTWIPYEPWGWCPSHYGRWHWRYGLGWYWIPTNLWGPAWVSWYWGYDYFGWAPLSYYGYPGVLINNIYYDRYRGDYPYRSRALTVIHKNQLKARDVSQVALRDESIGKIGKISLSSMRPPLRPAASKVSPEKLEGKKLMLKKIEGTPEREEANRTIQSTVRKPDAVDVKRTDKKAVTSTTKRAIKKGNYGYPSSPKISSKNYPRRIKTRKPSSLISRLGKGITSRTKSIKIKSSSRKDSSRGKSSSKRISSSSSSRSSSAASRRGSSSSRSSGSSRSSSSSGKVRKK